MPRTIFWGRSSITYRSGRCCHRQPKNRKRLVVYSNKRRTSRRTLFYPTGDGKGALCTLSEVVLENVSHPYILVDSCEKALKDIAEHYRKALDIKVVGITGSVGKTSTKEMIASVLEQKYHVLKTAGNFNNEIGLPLTIFNIRDEHKIAVLEMGINHFGEMHRLAKMARPDICVITNIGLCHLENLIDRDGILKAKQRCSTLCSLTPRSS